MFIRVSSVKFDPFWVMDIFLRGYNSVITSWLEVSVNRWISYFIEPWRGSIIIESIPISYDPEWITQKFLYKTILNLYLLFVSQIMRIADIYCENQKHTHCPCLTLHFPYRVYWIDQYIWNQETILLQVWWNNLSKKAAEGFELWSACGIKVWMEIFQTRSWFRVCFSIRFYLTFFYRTTEDSLIIYRTAKNRGAIYSKVKTQIKVLTSEEYRELRETYKEKGIEVFEYGD